MKRFISTFVLAFFFLATSAQIKDSRWLLIENVDHKNLSDFDKQTLDSILPLYHSSTNDSVKLTALIYLSENLENESLWTGYSRKVLAYKPSKNTTYITTLKANANNNIAVYEFNIGNPSEAIKFYNASIRLDSSVMNYKGLTNSIYNLAYLYDKQGDTKANELYTISLKLAQQINDKSGIARCKSGLASIYFEIGEDALGLKLSMEALELRKRMRDTVEMAASYNNIGNYYHNKLNYDRAYYFYIKSLELRRKTNDLPGMVSNYGNIGSIYLSRNELEKAKKYFADMYDLSMKLNNDLLIAYSHDNLSSLYQHLKDYKTAEFHALKTLGIGNKTNSTELQFRATDYLYKIYRAQKKGKEALLMLEQKIMLKEKLAGKEQQKAIIKQQFKFEYEKKEKDIKEKARIEAMLLKAAALEEKRRQNIITMSVSIGFILVLILAIVIFRSLQQNRKKNAIITEQKKLVEEKQKEIVDSIRYARRIQQSLMPTEKYLERNLKKDK